MQDNVNPYKDLHFSPHHHRFFKVMKTFLG